MFLTREEMTFDFGGAKFDPERDRELLGFVIDQFLYGEMTGIQVGHWFYQAPDFASAEFLARQSVEEIGHVRAFLEIYRLLDRPPGPAHPIVRWLATGFMGGTFVEHTLLEMAMGEGFVLTVMYALADTVDNARIARIVDAATVQEEKHVEFGELQTAAAIRRDPRLRGHLLGLALVSVRAVERFGPQIRRLAPEHPVLSQMPAFLEFAVRTQELRLQRIGILDRPLAEVHGLGASLRMAAALARRYTRPLRPRRIRRLTSHYLADPFVTGYPERRRPADGWRAMEREIR